MAGTVRIMMTSGVTILLAYAGTIMYPVAYDTWQRGAKAGAVTAECSLIILWTFIALVCAARKWKQTSLLFRLLLLVHGSVTCGLLAEVVRWAMERK